MIKTSGITLDTLAGLIVRTGRRAAPWPTTGIRRRHGRI